MDESWPRFIVEGGFVKEDETAVGGFVCVVGLLMSSA